MFLAYSVIKSYFLFTAKSAAVYYFTFGFFDTDVCVATFEIVYSQIVHVSPYPQNFVTEQVTWGFKSGFLPCMKKDNMCLDFLSLENNYAELGIIIMI